MLLNEIKMPVQKRSIDRLEKVIKTTVELLEYKPLEQCNIQEISQLSDVPRNHIYQYFPTIDHIYSIIVSRYFEKLRTEVIFSNEIYKTWALMTIIQDALSKTCEFYNKNKAASVLILGGPVNVDGFSLQEMVIEQISKDLTVIFTKKKHPLVLKNDDDITIMIELVFALMKYSFYKNKYITDKIQEEILLVCEAYLAKKNYI